jgi:hypothetical protein
MHPIWSFWRAYAHRIAERQTTLWLCLVYFLIVGPTWATARLAGKRFFPRPRPGASTWVDRPPAARTLADLRRMG